LLSAGPASFQTSPAAATPGQNWVATWSSAQVQPARTGVSATGFANQTVRQIVHISIGGSQVRLQLSNLYGTAPIRVESAQLGVSESGASIVGGTNRPVTVGQSASFVLPAGGEVLTDPIALPVAAGANLAVSLYFAAPTGPTTWHPVALTTSYVAAGNQAEAPGPQPYRATAASWYFLSGVDTVAPAGAGAVVLFGASTTDGVHSSTNTDQRWGDDLNRRVDQSGQGATLAIVNEGISGNRLLSGGGTCGPSGEARFALDALGQAGIRAVVVSSLGNDDIGYRVGPGGSPVTAQSIIAGYQRLIAEAHAAGVEIIGGTLTPNQGSAIYTPAGEAIREAVNQWILTSGAFDATINLAAAVANPQHPNQLLARYDSGDHLHPNDAGYLAIADSINLSLLAAA
jgi:lysophospholipase L1-like esterase